MKTLKNLLTKPLHHVPKWVPFVLLLVAFIGFADATYLTVEHYQNKLPPCTIGGCETVLSSEYAIVLGVPVALLGAMYYLAILISVFLFIDMKKDMFLQAPLLFTSLGVLASLWFVYLQLFVIHAFCPYCAVSGLTTTVLFIILLYVFLKNRSHHEAI